MKYSFSEKVFIDLEHGANKFAIHGSNGSYSWATFSNKVNELIDFFENEGLNQTFNPIIIYGHKSADMLVAIYACMSMNIPYIPIDSVYPEARVRKIIDSSSCNLIINTCKKRLDLFSTSEILLNKGISFFKKEERFILLKSNELDLVYIIFTSGSTGEPKGVQISNEAVKSFTKWMTSDDFGFSNTDVFINTALLSFDLSVFEVMTFGALGATIALNTKEESSHQEVLLNKIASLNGTIWISTPSFAFLYSRLDSDPRLRSVRTFLFCGEVLPHNLAKELTQKYRHAKVVNTYGPTEATVATTILNITADVLDKHNPLPVGFSKMDSKLLIENEEIIIVGPNVSVGYINRPDLNPKKFTSINGQRAFRTGDKGYLKDNMLFFYGRNDDMVKLHGYRIEINEITSVLHNLPYIFQAATVALERGGIVKKIVSLVSLKKNEIKNTNHLKFDLKKVLPDYMIPADIKIVDKIPLNQNGKTDKEELIKLYLRK